MRILVIKPSSLGDVVHALPTVARLRGRYPDAHIAWLINVELSPLLERCPLIHERIEFHRRSARTWLPLLGRLRRGSFDLVVDLQGLSRSGIFALATRAPRRIGLSDAREGSQYCYNETVSVPRQHAVDRYLKVADHLGCPPAPVEFSLGLASGTPARTLVAINPSARWTTKLWGDDRFAELVRRFPREQVILTGSRDEAPRLDLIAQGARNLAGKTTLLELADTYRQCKVVITNDSGPMHIAAAVGTPVVAIFGPTDPALTGPYGPGHVVLRSRVPCAPCFRGNCRHQPAMECMSQITVEQVLAAAAPFFK